MFSSLQADANPDVIKDKDPEAQPAPAAAAPAPKEAAKPVESKSAPVIAGQVFDGLRYVLERQLIGLYFNPLTMCTAS